MEELQKQLQALSEEFQKSQGELQTAVDARQKLESQQQENKGVQKARQNGFLRVDGAIETFEFAKLVGGAKIYKLVGPVLLKQDKNEAVMSVDARLEFIEKEIKRVEQQISDIQEKSEKRKMEIFQLQTQLQQQQEALAQTQPVVG
ncbi:MAG: hypothetical protein M1840_002119 [Geoglossum simile]|nr:MAG: hypothetical protein M1840_002119 [Geoglossum simile]